MPAASSTARNFSVKRAAGAHEAPRQARRLGSGRGARDAGAGAGTGAVAAAAAAAALSPGRRRRRQGGGEAGRGSRAAAPPHSLPRAWPWPSFAPVPCRAPRSGRRRALGEEGRELAPRTRAHQGAKGLASEPTPGVYSDAFLVSPAAAATLAGAHLPSRLTPISRSGLCVAEPVTSSVVVQSSDGQCPLCRWGN